MSDLEDPKYRSFYQKNHLQIKIQRSFKMNYKQCKLDIFLNILDYQIQQCN